MRKFVPVIVVTLAALVLSACGGSESPSAASADRAVTVTMTDNAFRPASVHVMKGEAISFTFVNDGKVDHEALIGDANVQAAHEKEMADMGGMDHGGADVLTVKPGKSGTVTHTFETAGDVLIGCHEPGHYKSGMKLTVTVS